MRIRGIAAQSNKRGGSFTRILHTLRATMTSRRAIGTGSPRKTAEELAAVSTLGMKGACAAAFKSRSGSSFPILGLFLVLFAVLSYRFACLALCSEYFQQHV